jgi:pyruvate, water dikinase
LINAKPGSSGAFNSTLEQVVVDRFVWLDQIQAIAEPWVGSEIVALGQLGQAGLPVEQGFVISAQMLLELLSEISEPLFDNFLDLDLEQPQQLQAIACTLQQAIQAASLPPAWSTQIEAAISEWGTGVLSLRPFLWIAEAECLTQQNLLQPQFCWRQLEALQTALKQLWADLYQAKNLLFWQQTGLSLAQVRLAVLVQPVHSAQAAGLVRSNLEGWQIESSYGLGDVIALGEVIPDRYQLAHRGLAVQQQTLGQKTYVYAPADPSQTEACIAGLPFSASNQFALSELQLQQLIGLIPKVQAQLGDSYCWTWAWQEMPANGLPQLELRILQVTQTKIPAAIAQRPALELPKSHLLKIGQGIAAASGQAIAKALILNDSTQVLATPPTGKILVVSSFQPEWLPWLKQSVGIICETGGMTSHGAIMARELGIPAVVGMSGATTQIAPNKLVLLDGEQGQVYEFSGDRPPTPVLTPRPLAVPSDDLPLDGQLKTQLLVNLSQTYALAHAQTLPVNGVGLLRSEVILPEVLQYHHPDLWLQQGRQAEIVAGLAAQIQQFAAAFHPRPVFYRALDLRSHEGRGLLGGQQFEPMEGNPTLGRRGVSRYVANPELFDLQLAALRQVHQAGYPHLHLLLPFVRSVEEFEVCQQRVDRAGLFKSHMQLWLMAEVPSVLFLLPSYVRAGVQGISIGSNDLTQLLLGIDREQGHLNQRLDERHPAVKAAIAQLIKTAQELGIPCTICGEAPVHHPELVDWLVELGITGISVAPESVLVTQQAIAQAEQRHLIQPAGAD